MHDHTHDDEPGKLSMILFALGVIARLVYRCGSGRMRLAMEPSTGDGRSSK